MESTRMCAVCRQRMPKENLIRIVRVSPGIAHVDPTGHAPGRGCYICGSEDCLSKLPRNRFVSRAFKGDYDPSIYEEIIAYARQQ